MLFTPSLFLTLMVLLVGSMSVASQAFFNIKIIEELAEKQQEKEAEIKEAGRKLGIKVQKVMNGLWAASPKERKLVSNAKDFFIPPRKLWKSDMRAQQDTKQQPKNFTVTDSIPLRYINETVVDNDYLLKKDLINRIKLLRETVKKVNGCRQVKKLLRRAVKHIKKHWKQ